MSPAGTTKLPYTAIKNVVGRTLTGKTRIDTHLPDTHPVGVRTTPEVTRAKGGGEASLDFVCASLGDVPGHEVLAV